MAVDTSAVQIVINVTDANSGQVVAQLEKSLSGLGAAGATSGKKMASALNEVGAAAKTADAASAQAASHMGSHFQTSFDRVRLLRTELGVQMPRAMESVIARSQLLMGVINGLGGALVAIGAAGIFISLGKELYNVYERWLDVNAASKQYQKELEKTQQEDFGNTRSIEDTTARINEATDALKQWQKYKNDQYQQSRTGINILEPVGAITHNVLGSQADKQVVEQEKILQSLKQHADEQAHQTNVQRIESEHALDGELRGRQKINAELAKKVELSAEDRRFSVQESELHGNASDPNAGKSEMEIKNAIAQREAEAATFNLQREQAHELTQLRNEATNAQLRGVALYKAQEAQAIEELKFKDMDSAAARAAVHAKFHAEEMRRLQDELEQTQMIQAHAAMVGMTGIEKTQAEGDIEIGKIRGDNNLTDEAKDARVAAAQRETQAQIVEQQRSFSEEIDRITDESATHQVSGFARIQAEEIKQLDELKKKFDQTYGSMDMTAPGASRIYQQGQADLERGQAAIHSGAAQQEQDLASKNAEQTAQIEAEARGKFLSAEKQKTEAIESEYEQRLQKYKDQLNQQEISYDDYNRRVAAAAEQRDAEMVAEAQAARQKMAGEFDSLFRSLNHPLEALQSLGEKAAANAAASIIERARMRGQPGAPQEKTGWAGVFDTFGLSNVGGPGQRDGGLFRPARAATPVTPATPLPSSPQQQTPPQVLAEMATPHAQSVSEGHTLSFASAQIHVDSAAITFGGGAGSGTGGGTRGAFSSTTADTLGGAGIPSAGGGITGIASDAQSGIGFASSAGRTIGGAGSAGSPGAPASTGGGATEPGGSGSNVLGNLQKGVGLGQSLTKDFSGNSSKVVPFSEINGPNDPLGLNHPGNSTTASVSNGGMLGGGGIAANAGGAAGGALGLFGAYEGNGGTGGALSGALSGAELGMSVAGPVGAAVGAIGGAVLGAIGFGGREKARVYDLKQIRPRITADQDAYAQGSMDYLAAYSDLQSADMAAKKATNAMGPAAQSYYQDTIKKELKQAEARFTAEQQAGRSMYTASAAQFAVGSDYVPRDGMAMIHEGERIMPSDQNERITQAIEGGGTMHADSGAPGDVHIHLHAIDAKSGAQWLMANKHVLRSAVNSSYAENSGGSDATN